MGDDDENEDDDLDENEDDNENDDEDADGDDDGDDEDEDDDDEDDDDDHDQGGWVQGGSNQRPEIQTAPRSGEATMIDLHDQGGSRVGPNDVLKSRLPPVVEKRR